MGCLPQKSSLWTDTQISLTEQMNKRAIVNVATGEFYCKMQDRLRNSLTFCTDNLLMLFNDGSTHEEDQYPINMKHYGIDVVLWTDVLPRGSREHSESPYGFKVHAIKAAYEMGYTSILWLDSPAYAVKEDISPIFDKIEKEGYYAMSHIDPLERFVGDAALQFYNIKRLDLIGLNLPSGSCYGFDMKGIGHRIVANLELTEINGLFKDEVSEDGMIVHRHDEAILALYLKLLGKPVFTFDPLFQSDSPECVIKSGGDDN